MLFPAQVTWFKHRHEVDSTGPSGHQSCSAFPCSLMPSLSRRENSADYLFSLFDINCIHIHTFVQPPLGPPCRSGPDVSFSHVQYELIDICGGLAFPKSRLGPDPAQAHSDHPEMGGLDGLFLVCSLSAEFIRLVLLDPGAGPLPCGAFFLFRQQMC